MIASPPRIGGLDVQSWGDPQDPVVLLIGAPQGLSPDWRRWVRALVEAGRHVLLADALEAGDEAAGLRRLLDHCHAQGTPVLNVETRRSGLEDLFMKLHAQSEAVHA